MQAQAVRVRVPASTANLGPGFDTLGMALELYAEIEMKAADVTRIRLKGDALASIPTSKDNLVYKVAQQVFQQAGVRIPELDIVMKSDIPLARGLGSSASAIIGGMVAANEMIGRPLSDQDLFSMACGLEDHPDNVGASLFGGIVIGRWDGEHARHIRLDPDPRLEVLVIVPDFHLETKKARQVLPDRVAFRDAVFNVSHVSLLTAALCSGQLDMIRHAMCDRLHQPHRSALIPGMTRILEEAQEHGALGAALSGAGPSMLALVEAGSADRDRLEQFFAGTLREQKIECETMWLRPARFGARLLP